MCATWCRDWGSTICSGVEADDGVCGFPPCAETAAERRQRQRSDLVRLNGSVMLVLAYLSL